MRTRLVLALVVIAGLAAAPAGASPRVAVGPFEGDRTGDLQDIVIELLETDYRIVNQRDVTRAAEKLDLEGDLDNKKSLGKLAKELDTIGVVVGEVEPDGNKSKLTLTVYVARTKRAFRMTARFSTARQVRASSLKDDLRDKLGRDPDAGGIGRDDRDRDRDDRDRDDRDRDDRDRDDGDRDDRDRDRDRDDDDDTRTASRDDDDDRDRDDDDDDDDGVSTRATLAVRRNARTAAVRFEVGVSAIGRQLNFNTNLAEDQAPPPYKSNLVPGARIHAELYPLALSDPYSAAAGLGLAGDFDRALGLTTTSSLAPDEPLTTTMQNWSIGARYRLAFGNRAMTPTFIVGVGYGQRKFTIDRAPLDGMTLDLPDVVYTYIDPSLFVRIPLHPSAAVVFGGRGLLMRDTGPIGKTDQYGKAKVFGVDAEAGLEFVIGRYFLVHVAGLFSQVGYTFNGGAEQTNNRDGDAGSLDVGGAQDRYFGAMGTVGVVY
jgi:hypothetical protein